MINERIDDLMRDGLKLIQNTDIFCFGMDAVLLSTYATAGKKDRVLDMGTGNGIIPVLMQSKNPGSTYSALEIQEGSAQLARRNVELNHLENRISVVKGDIKEASTIFGEASFNVVTSNPPYMNENHGIVNPDSAKAIARHELLCSLDDVIREASRCLKSKGKMYMVHRPNRLVDIFDTMRKYHLEPKRMRLVYPYVNKAANMVLIEAVKGGNSQLIVEEPLIVYKTDGIYTDALLKMYNNSGVGQLYLCATPIGNLEDITYRVLRVLSEADLIAAEDTRNSIKLLNHFEIKTPMTSYHEFNKYDKAKVLVDKILGGMDVAVITDAGTPGISDPGEELVKQCRAAGIRVTSLPGPAACITALTMSGRETRRFAFEAFLPADKNERKEVLAELACETRTMIIYEAPHRLTKTLAELQDTLGGDRQITICKELTKRYENSMEFTLESACEYYENNEPRGEYVLVIAGKSREQLKAEARKQWENMSVAEHVQMYMSQGMDKKEAMKAAAKDRGVSKRDIYQELEGKA